MINHLKEFFSSPPRQLKGWELPLAGLLLTAGLTVAVSALQAAAPDKQAKSADSPALPPSLQAVQEQQEQAVDSTALPPNLQAAAPQQQKQAVEAPVSAASFDAPVPPQQEQAVEAPAAPSFDAAQEQQEQAVEPLATAPSFDAAQEQQEQAVEAPAEAPSYEAAAPQKLDKGVDSTSVAMPSAKWNPKAQAARKGTIAQAPNSDNSLADGTYLYGQSSQAGQVGKEYLVFEARQGKVVGAMYMPSSEFACFHGTLNSKQMNLTVVNPYDETALSHTIARQQHSQIAAVGNQLNYNNTLDSVTYPYSVGLEGYQPIAQVGDKDKQILNTCRSNYQTAGWNR